MRNPPAFPQPKDYDDAYAELRGMTLRDYFAAKAMQALLTRLVTPSQGVEKFVATVVGSSYEYADAMLKERLNAPTS